MKSTTCHIPLKAGTKRREEKALPTGYQIRSDSAVPVYVCVSVCVCEDRKDAWPCRQSHFIIEIIGASSTLPHGTGNNTTRREDEKLKLKLRQQQQLNSSCLFRSRPARLSCAHVRASAQMSNHSVPLCEVPWGWLSFLALTCLVSHLISPCLASHLIVAVRLSRLSACLYPWVFSLSLSPSHSVCLPPGHANKIAENPQPTKVLTNAFGLRWRRWHLSRFVRDSEAICARFAPKLIKRVESQFCSRRGVRQVSMEIKQKGLPNAISYLGAWQANLTEAAVAFELSNSRRMMSHWLESEPGNLSHYINSSSNNRKRV